MANLKISQLNNGNPTVAGDQIPINRGGTNFSVTSDSIATWSFLQPATGALTLANAGNATTFNQTSAVNWTWANTTVATVSTTNASPNLIVSANYWTGAASAADTWKIASSLVAGSNAQSTLSITHAGSTGNPKVSFFAAANEFLRIAPSLGSSPPVATLSAQTTNQRLVIQGGLTTSTVIGAPSIAFTSTALVGTTAGTQVGVAAGTNSSPLTFSPGSGTANFIGFATNSTATASLSSGAVTGFLVNVIGTAISGTFLTADFQNDNGSVFQVGKTGAIFPTGGGIGTLTDNNASTGTANQVLSASGTGGQVTWSSKSPGVFNDTQTGLVANYNAGAAKTLVTPTVTKSVYRISAMEATTNTPTGATLPSLTIGWTDAASVARTLALLATAATSANTTLSQAAATIMTDGATAVTVTSAGYAAGSGTALQYELAVTCEQLV